MRSVSLFDRRGFPRFIAAMQGLHLLSRLSWRIFGTALILVNSLAGFSILQCLQTLVFGIAIMGEC
jgi:hypothetical protein